MCEQSSLIFECSNDPFSVAWSNFSGSLWTPLPFSIAHGFNISRKISFSKEIVRSEPRFIGCCQEESIVLVHKVERIVGDFRSSLSPLDVWLAVQSSGLAIAPMIPRVALDRSRRGMNQFLGRPFELHKRMKLVRECKLPNFIALTAIWDALFCILRMQSVMEDSTIVLYYYLAFTWLDRVGL